MGRTVFEMDVFKGLEKLISSKTYFLVGLSLVLLLFTVPVLSKTNLLFFDPDASLTNVIRVKGSLQRYLRKVDKGASFQPITKYKAFLRLIKAKKPQFVLVSSSYFKKHAKQFGWEPLLIANKDGKLTYTKILLTRESESPQAGTVLKIRSIATTSTKSYVKALQLDQSKIDAKSATVIQVTKDIDALLALSYSQVESALLVPASLNYLKEVNPESVKGMKKVYQTPEAFNPVLCFVKGLADEQKTKLYQEAFAKILKDKDGKAFMKFLGYSSWDEVPEKLRGFKGD